MTAHKAPVSHLAVVTHDEAAQASLQPAAPQSACDDRRSSRRETTQRLFAQLDKATDEARRRYLRQRIVEENMPVASSIARRYYGRGESLDDLEQVAYVGLAKSVARFDLARKKDFLSFAVPTIAGEVKRHFRDHCWTVRPPRRVQEMQAKISATRERLTQDLGRQANAGDIAAELDVAESEVAEALSADGCFLPSSLDAPTGAEASTPIGESIGECDGGFERCEGHLLLVRLLEELTPREQEILRYRFVEGWSQDQIGRRIGVTQMQVSRLLSRILRHLGMRAAA